MASPAQILANQTNAQLSTGPKSVDGKAASAANAAKHGLASAFRVLAHENQDEFTQLVEARYAEHKPVTLHQQFLVDQLAKSEWLLARAQRLQAQAFEYLAGAAPDPADPDSTIVAKMFETNPNALLSLQRYASQAEKSYYKAWRELAKAKQIQNEANYAAHVDTLAQNAVLHRALQSPPPDHPAFGPEPAATQYGYIPHGDAQVQQVRTAARARNGSLCC